MELSTKILAVCLAAFGVSGATVNFPFPQNVDYGNGIEVSDKATAATQLKSAFNYYLTDKYKESGNYAAIEKDHGSNTFVSEGIGYGMLMMVYFSDNTTSYQDQFDKLWAFYKAGSNDHGLMNWSFGGLNPYNNNANAATDAEMDVAAALIMAAYQFGDDKYLDEAKTLLGNVKKYEFEENGLHKPGDAWNDKKNPSYIAPAYYRLFAAVDTDNATFWNTTAMDANYALLEANSAEYSTGLFDNWSNASGKGLDSYYGYDAARTPWRLAQDFYWFGETKAQTMLSKLGTWVSGYAASDMKGTIERSGSPMWNDHNSTFVATLMTSLVTDASRQTKLDEYWSEVASLGDEAYFEQSMKILCGLLVTGNMPNLTAGTPSGGNGGGENGGGENGGNENGGGNNPPEALPRTVANHTGFSFTNNTVNLDLQDVSNVELLNLQGQKLQTLWNGRGTGSTSLKVSAKKGIYLVRIQGQGIAETHKIAVR